MTLDMIQEKITKYRETKMGDEKIEEKSLLKCLELSVAEAFGKIIFTTNLSSLSCCILIIIGFLQVFSIVLDINFGFSKFDSLSYLLTPFIATVGVFEIVLESEVANLSYVIAILFLFLLVLYLVLLIVVMCTKKVKDIFFLSIMPLFTASLYWIFLIPMGKLFFSVFECNDNMVKFDNKMSCWGNTHIIWICILGFSMLLLLLLTLAITIFGNDPNPYSVDHPLARFNWGFEKLFWAYRVLIIVLSVLIPKGTVRTSIVIWSLCLVSLKIVQLYRKSYPYYCKAVEIIFGICCHSMLWISFLLVLKEIITNYLSYEYEGESVLILGGIVCIIKLVNQLYKTQFYWSILKKREADIKTEDEFNQFIRSFIGISLSTKNTSQFEKLILDGYLFTHKITCRNVKCPLNNKKLMSVSKELNKESIINRQLVSSHLIQVMYRNILELSSSTELMQIEKESYVWQRSLLSYVYFLIHKIGNYHAAAIQLFKIDLSNPSLSIRSTAHCIKYELESIHEHLNEKKLLANGAKVLSVDPRLLLEYEAKFGHFKDKVFKIAGTYREVWIQLLSPYPDLNLIQKNMDEVFTDSLVVKELRKQLCALYSNYEKAEILYVMYLSDILGQEELAERHLNDYNTVVQHQNSVEIKLLDTEDLFDSDTIVIAISAMPETTGNIIKASNGVSKLFEYSSNELIGKNINLIMPQCIADKHNSFINSYVTSGVKRVINTLFNTFAADKQQYLFQIKLFIREYHDFLYGSVFVAMLTAYQSQSFIVTNSDGVIIGFSRDASREFGTTFSPIFIREYAVKIWYLIPELKWGCESTDETYESIIGERKVTFIMPHNMIKILQNLHGKRDDLINKSSEVIANDFDYKDAPKKIWKCTIMNIEYKELKLKRILFKPEEDHFYQIEMNKSDGISKNLEVIKDIDNMTAEDYESMSIKHNEENNLANESSAEPEPAKEKEDDKTSESDNIKEKETLQQLNRKAILREIDILNKINYKQYIPPLIKWVLRYALFYTIVGLVITTLFIVYMMIIISALKKEFDVVVIEREICVLEINKVISSLLLVNNYTDNKPILDPNIRNKYNFTIRGRPDIYSPIDSDYISRKYSELLTNVNMLDDFQEEMNRKASKLLISSIKEAINPNSVIMYMSAKVNSKVDFNTLISTFVDQAIKASKLQLKDITTKNPSVSFLMINGYGNLWNMDYESNQILDEVYNICNKAMLIIFIGIIVLAGFGFLFIFVLVPLWKAIAQQDIKSVQLMLKIKSQQLRDQIEKCGKLMQFISVSENEDFNFDEQEELSTEEKREESNNSEDDEGLHEKDQLKDENRKLLKEKRVRSKRTHKFKGHERSIKIFVVLYLSMVLSALGYYVILFLYPLHFEESSYKHLEELIMLRYEHKMRPRLYGLTLEVIRSRIYDSAHFSFTKEYYLKELDKAISISGLIIDHFNDYHHYFSTDYSYIFREIMQMSFCNDAFRTNTEECNTISNGILLSGMYAANAYYLTLYQNAITNILAIPSDKDYIEECRKFINSEEFIFSELEKIKYHETAIVLLTSLLKNSFLDHRNFGKVVMTALISVAYLVIVLIYFVFWNIYINCIRKNLLKSKMILCRIPMTMIVNTPSINQYFFKLDKEILSNLSKTNMHLIA